MRHELETEAPSTDEYVPAAQFTHTTEVELPVVEEYIPTPQSAVIYANDELKLSSIQKNVTLHHKHI